MQNGSIKLKEIIWEITGRCENGCDYCGSKDAWNATVDEDKIIKIAEKIAMYPPEEIDISGGDPLLVSYKTHQKVVEILKKQNIKCKILINPKSFLKKENLLNPNVLSLYDWVGISINTEEELSILTDKMDNNILQKSSIITNFNLQNVFIYKEIEQFVTKHNLIWQIQYTIYKDSNNPLAIYNNKNALLTLSEYVLQSISDGVKVLVADNASCGRCTARTNSIGLSHTGDVVPCLSMRSWVENIQDVVVGNLLDDAIKDVNSLESIWLHNFNKYRFNNYICCKDICKNKIIDLNMQIKISVKTPNDLKKLSQEQPYENHDERVKTYPASPVPYRVVLYGCPSDYPDGTYVYACPSRYDYTISVYAVASPSTAPHIISATGTTNDKTDPKNQAT